MYDVIIDGNRIEHSPVGIQVGPQVRGAVISGNTFVDVGENYGLASPRETKVIER